jgi:hypothetical protein
MNYRTKLLMAGLLLLVFFCARPVHGAAISVSEYRQQLRDLTEKVDSLKDHPERAGRIEADLPDHVSVRVDTGEYSVSYQSLKNQLAAVTTADPQKKQALVQEVQDHLKYLSDEAAAYEGKPADLAHAREQMKEILARREFTKVGGPSAFDLLLARIYHWLGRVLRRIFSVRGPNFDVAQVLIYLLIAIAISVLAVWITRRLMRPAETVARREIIPFSPSAKGWRAWLAEARSLAQQQEWRESVHLAYWAGISFLEERGAWKPDRARTPREYLRLLNARAATYPVLTALTGKFEVIWYGHRDASQADFQDALGHLEKLGCR